MVKPKKHKCSKNTFAFALLIILSVSLFTCTLKLSSAEIIDAISVKTLDSFAKVDSDNGVVTLSKDSKSMLVLTPSGSLMAKVDGQSFVQSKGMANISNADVSLSTYRLTNGLEVEATINSLDFLKKNDYLIKYGLSVKGLNLVFQPALNEELNVKNYDFVNETHAIRDGKVVNFRPENVVGSYAVYYSDGSGKAFHVYRPWAIDAKGSKSWCDLIIDVELGVLQIAVPKEFADKAVYPLIVDPSFGYTSIGASTFTIYDWFSHVACRQQAPEDGNITGLNWYGSADNKIIELLVYSDNSGLPNTLLGNGNVTVSATEQWWNVTGLNIAISSSSYYWLAVMNYNFGLGHHYDVGGVNQTVSGVAGTGYNVNPFGAVSTYYNYSVSIFANYTASSVGDLSAPTYSGLSASSTLAGSTCLFNATFTDETALHANGQYQFGTNNTGPWVWDSAVNFTSTPQTVSVSKALNSSIGKVIGYCWNFTDNAGNSNSTGVQTLTTTAAYVGLQARDKDGLNLPRAVTFSGTLPNGTAYSVTSNTAGLYSLPCSNGTLTVAVTWQDHAVKASSSVSVTANATSNLDTSIARLNYSSTQYVLISVNETTLNTPTLTTLNGYKIDNVAGSSQKSLVIDQANWVVTSNPLTLKIGGNSYGVANWQFTSNIITYNYVDFDAYADPTIEVIYALSSGDTSGGSGGDSVPISTPSTFSPLGANDFQISNLELGTVQPNSTVTATLHLRYSGSSYTFKELYLSNPFYTWFVPNSVSLTTYVLTNPSESSADVTLSFYVPADVPAEYFEGEIRFTVLDAFGASHTSNAVVSASVEGATKGFDFGELIRDNLLLVIIIVVAVLAVLGYLASKIRR